MKALKRSWRGRKYTGTELPVFIEANNLKPFISKELEPVLTPRQIRTNRGATSEAFPAEVLPAVCDIPRCRSLALSKRKAYGRTRKTGVASGKGTVASLHYGGLLWPLNRGRNDPYRSGNATAAVHRTGDSFVDYDLHPLCTLFPRISGDEYQILVSDIRENGLREPITLHGGMILDGGNRYRACLDAGVSPSFREFGGENIVTFVLSANLHRRHLSPGQQAAIVASAQDWAKAQTVGKPKSGNLAGLDRVQDRAAQSGASDRTQRMADKVVRENPELAAKVGRGEVSLPEAVERVTGKKPGKKPSKILPRNLPPEKEPENYGPDDAEIAMLEERDRIERASFDKLIQSDDALAAATAEIKRLAAELAVVKQQRDGYMNRCNELIRQVRSLKREAARA